MAQIILSEAKCEECGTELPAMSIAEVITPDFIVCIRCNQETNDAWSEMQYLISTGKLHEGLSGPEWEEFEMKHAKDQPALEFGEPAPVHLRD